MVVTTTTTTIRLQSKSHIQTLQSLENVQRKASAAEEKHKNREKRKNKQQQWIESKWNEMTAELWCGMYKCTKTHTFLGTHEKRKEMRCFTLSNVLSVFQLNWFRYCHFTVFVVFSTLQMQYSTFIVCQMLWVESSQAFVSTYTHTPVCKNCFLFTMLLNSNRNLTNILCSMHNYIVILFSKKKKKTSNGGINRR